MINNVVIKVDGEFKPKDNDILVFNSKKNAWEIQTKEVLFNDINKKIKELKAKIEEVEKLSLERANQNQDKIIRIARILKKEIK